MTWQQLDVEIGPGHYHFPPQAPRLPMLLRRAAIMRGYDTEMGALGAGDVTLTVHDRPAAGAARIEDSDLAHFDVAQDGSTHPRSA